MLAPGFFDVTVRMRHREPMQRRPSRPKPSPSPALRNRAADIKTRSPKYGLARVLSKRGFCSRSEAEAMVRAGRVATDGRIQFDPHYPTALNAVIDVDGAAAQAAARVYLMLNKPRGLVTTTQDEQGRDTVYRCFDGAGLPWIAPVGRLDKASEGLLLFSNDPEWAAALTSPESQVDKTYHAQIDTLPDEDLVRRLCQGMVHDGDFLRAKTAKELRRGDKHAWLEIQLDEGRNRHIRRLLEAQGIGVLRLIRVAIGALALGDLPKQGWRALTGEETAALRPPV
jgi:23S rRNA pseudouridine2605 synthase